MTDFTNWVMEGVTCNSCRGRGEAILASERALDAAHEVYLVGTIVHGKGMLAQPSGHLEYRTHVSQNYSLRLCVAEVRHG